MALKSNTKKAMENVKKYIMTDSDYIMERAEYDGIKLETPEEYASYVYKAFLEEYGWSVRRIGAQRSFAEWAAGLAMGGLFLYYYNADPYEIISGILEETPEESERQKARIDENAACDYLTYWIFRVCEKASKKVIFE